MPPKEKKKKGTSRSTSKKANERKEKKLLEERINSSKQKCEEARVFLEPTGKHGEPSYSKAKEALEEALTLYNAHPLPYLLLGECHRAQGELAAAIDFYSKALDVDPRSTTALEARAFCHQHLGDIVHAIEDYTSMIDQDPENDHAYNMRGVCLASTRVPGLRLRAADFERCESDLKTAAHLNEANYHALANLGKLYEDQGELEKALTCYTTSLRVNESYSYARFRRGCAALRLAEKVLLKDDDDEDGADGSAPDSATVPAAVVSDISEIEREAGDKIKKEAARENARTTLREAEADFTSLLGSNPETDRNLTDVNVLLNLGTCAMLLEDLDRAGDSFALADEVIGARPALVEAGEALPIENVEEIRKVLELRRGVLRQKKLKRAQAGV